MGSQGSCQVVSWYRYYRSLLRLGTAKTNMNGFSTSGTWSCKRFGLLWVSLFPLAFHKGSKTYLPFHSGLNIEDLRYYQLVLDTVFLHLPRAFSLLRGFLLNFLPTRWCVLLLFAIVEGQSRQIGSFGMNWSVRMILYLHISSVIARDNLTL